MPVSNPSYFPPSRGTDQIVGITAGQSQTGARVFLAGQNAGSHSTISDFIVIGHNAASNNIADAGLNGTTVIGSNSMPVLANVAQAGNTPTAMTVYGSNNIPLLQHGDSSVIIGSGNLPLYVGSSVNSGLQRSVVIGNGNLPAMNTTTSLDTSVVIGYKVGASNTFAFTNCTIIGSQALGTFTGAMADHTILGWNAHSSAGTGGGISSKDTVIGSNATGNGQSNEQVLIGYSASALTNDAIGNVSIGASTRAFGQYNVVIGYKAQNGFGTLVNAQRCITIGPWAGRTMPNFTSDVFIVESNDPSGTQKAALYADMANGNVLLGSSTDAANRSAYFPGSTNSLGLLNGIRGAGNPTGGGFFYVVAGALHWVGSAGTDTVVAPA